ncbi:MAG: pentapeptide repeat-containing protein, partial [Cyanobacteriota bacterium]
MRYFPRLAAFVLALILLLCPLSAQAAETSSSSSLVNKINFSGQDFSGRSFPAAEFNSLILKKTNFSNANLQGAVF